MEKIHRKKLSLHKKAMEVTNSRHMQLLGSILTKICCLVIVEEELPAEV